jgi:pyrroloquinoline quinone (PQQ) biosynthesis protein C
MIVLDNKRFEGMSTDRFIKELASLRVKYPFGLHPVVNAIVDGSLPREGLKSFLIQWWYFGAVGSEQIFPEVLARMPIDHRLYPIKKKIVENIYSEFFEPEIHPEVNVNMITKGMGITREEVYNSEILPETSAFVKTLQFYSAQSWEEGMMSLMWALESQSPVQFKQQTIGLRQKYGFQDTQFVDMHIMMDAEHADEADDFARAVIRPDNMRRLWNAAADSIEAIWYWHDALYRRYMPGVPATKAKAA